MIDDIPEIADTPKAALASFITELETYYYSWYDSATTRNYYTWFVAQVLSLLSGFATAVIAALLHNDQFKSWGLGHIALVVVPLVGALASTFLVQSRIAELEALREAGREAIQRLANEARANFASASSPQEYTKLHLALAAEVSTLEREQSRSFQRIIPKPLTFMSHGAPRRESA
ncbi:MAG: hypothetical protein ACHQQS_01045 [Thermoanaerobaculales bacterium]